MCLFWKLCSLSQGDVTKLGWPTSICPVRAQSCFVFGQLLDRLILLYFCGNIVSKDILYLQFWGHIPGNKYPLFLNVPAGLKKKKIQSGAFHKYLTALNEVILSSSIFLIQICCLKWSSGDGTQGLQSLCPDSSVKWLPFRGLILQEGNLI